MPLDPKSTFSQGSSLKKTVKSGHTSKSRLILYVLAGLALLGILIFAIYRLTRPEETKVEDSWENVWFTNTEVENVQSVDIELATGETLHVSYDGELYHTEEIPDALLSQSACQSAFANAAELLAERQAADDVTDPAAFGLKPPKSVVTIRFYDGKDFTLEIGDQAPTSAHYYVREAGKEQIYLMKALLVNLYAGGRSAFRDVSGFAIDTDSVVALELQREGQPDLLLDYMGKPTGFRFTSWYLHEPFLTDVVNDEVENYLHNIGALKLLNFVDECGDEAAFAQYGLDQPQALITLSYGDNSGVIIAVGGSDNLGNRYLRFNESAEVYLGDRDSLAFLDDLELPGLVSEFSNIFQYRQVAALTVTLDGKSTTFTLDRSGKDTTVARSDGTAVDEAAFKEMFLAICDVKRSNIVYDQTLPADTKAALVLEYGFTDGSSGTVEYLDASINDYYLRKNGSLGVSVRKDDCAEMLSKLRALLP